MNDSSLFFEVDYYQINKSGMSVAGDVFLSTRSDDGSIVTVLADGLGSGIKANVLATLTAKMASVFVLNSMDIRKSAEIIIDTLPVCSERKIGYSTFTVARIEPDGNAFIIEYDNPGFVFLSQSGAEKINCERIDIKSSSSKKNFINYYTLRLERGNRLVFFSDGVTQSGMGCASTPLGWGSFNTGEYIEKLVNSEPGIGAGKLSRSVVSQALAHDIYKAHDDITCEVICCRDPRKLLLVTGPSMHPEKDREMSERIRDFKGCRIICGGTTSQIVSRELDIDVEVDISKISRDIPPKSLMKGIDLVTEGILTLCRIAELLESGKFRNSDESNAATEAIAIMMNNDIIYFLVGTRINEAHQDPSMPREIEIRRNIIKKIIYNLENKYLKKTELQFI